MWIWAYSVMFLTSFPSILHLICTELYVELGSSSCVSYYLPFNFTLNLHRILSGFGLIFSCFLPPPPPTPFCAACEDKSGDCAGYGQSICTGQYAAWATDNCAKYCGHCSSGGGGGGTSLGAGKTAVFKVHNHFIISSEKLHHGIFTHITIT